MVVKAEQQRIKTLLRDTITLLCRNGLTFKAQFSIEALIGITLDEDDVMLVSINEMFKPQNYNNSSDEDGTGWDHQGEPYHDGYSPGRSGDRNKRRRRRKRSYIKSEITVSDEEDSTFRGASSLLDLSTASYQAAATVPPPVTSKEDHPPPSKKSCADDEPSRDTGDQSAGVTDDQHSDDEKRSEHAVIVKKEYTDESWPPAGVMQEVTIGGSDTNSEPSYPPYGSTASNSSILQHLNTAYRGQDSMTSPCSSPHNLHLPGLPMMNGMPFPTMSMPQSHFAQALGRLVGSMPPTLPQHIQRPAARNSTPSKSAAAVSSGTSPNLYQPTSRSTLPKEAVSLMSEWLRKNQHNPYPTDDIKDDFVRSTNLTYNQINYWFTNARRRLLPKWELQRKIEEQQLAERMSQRGSHGMDDSDSKGWMPDDGSAHRLHMEDSDSKVWVPPESDESKKS